MEAILADSEVSLDMPPTAASSEDIETIIAWNSSPSQHLDEVEQDSCVVHDLIAAATKLHTHSEAIHAWDGSLSYNELDSLSTLLARHLVSIGVRPNSIVPICFEKSFWTPVAVVGVMKAGGASIILDSATQPEQRLGKIVQQTDAVAIVSSVDNRELAERLAGLRPVVTVGKESQQSWVDPITSDLPTVLPKDRLYLVSTSGSTGIPKIPVMTHGNFTSAVRHQQSFLRLNPESRVYDGVSYSFDVTWSNMLHVLCVGGVICIPRETERVADISNAISRLRANYIHITPTVARLIDPDVASSLRTIVFIGEPLRLRDIQPWKGRGSALMNTFGPAEATVTTTLQVVDENLQHDPSIGVGIGAKTWVVDSVSEACLVPIGNAGELWIEGPIVGAGYLNDLEKTKQSFVEDPVWLPEETPGEFCGSEPRARRFYKTGDIVRYNEDSTLQFIGRKDDGYTKIRGQRLELGEIEHHIQESLGETVEVVAELVTRGHGEDETILVAFISAAIGTLEKMQRRMSTLDELLAKSLPAYMIPSAYIVLESIPLTATGKTDRRQLREIAKSQARQVQRKRPPETDDERKVQSLWASIMNVRSEEVGRDDSFMDIGGDSVSAIKLAAAARRQCLNLTVEMIMKQPRLCDMAATIAGDAGKILKEGEPVLPFSLLPENMAEFEARRHAAELCNLVSSTDVEDVYPCTPLQEGLLALTAKRTADYVESREFQLSPTIDHDRFKLACAGLVAVSPILRTRIVDFGSSGLQQVVIRNGALDFNFEQQKKEFDGVMGLGAPLVRFRIDRTKNVFEYTIHHAIHDGWTLPLLLETLEQAYLHSQKRIPTPPPFAAFVKHVLQLDREGAAEFWKNRLKDCEAETFPPPALSSQSMNLASPQFSQSIPDHVISGIHWPTGTTHVTSAKIVRAAWAILIAQLTDNTEAVFGETVSGREAVAGLIPGVDAMTGPTIATIPVRVQLEPPRRSQHLDGTSCEETVIEFLRRVQEEGVEAAAWEQFGLQSIRAVSDEARKACDFGTLLVVQPAPNIRNRYDEDEIEGRLPFLHFDDVDDEFTALTYPLSIECRLENSHAKSSNQSGLRIRVRFQPSRLSAVQARRLPDQFEHILRRICAPETSHMSVWKAIQGAGPLDLREIWKLNAEVAEPLQKCMHDLIASRAVKFATREAICGWDGSLTYAELETLSTKLAYRLAAAGVFEGAIVPLCFEKSRWVPVAMLAVMKAGAASVALDVTHPEERLRSIVRQVKPVLILTSVSATTVAERLVGNLDGDYAVPTVVVGATEMAEIDTSEEVRPGEKIRLPIVHPSSPLYVVFTSGSSGVPKGVIISHTNFSSAVALQQRVHDYGPPARVLDFASYAFDASWSNTLHTLSMGGCVCIPSEGERRDDLAGSMVRMQVTHADLTPSVARAIRLEHGGLPPDLHTLLLAGEALSVDEARAWVAEIPHVYHLYGPAECTVAATCAKVNADSPNPNSIGYGIGTNTWVVDTRHEENLAPIGAVGELWLEGPLVGSGYLGNDSGIMEKNALAFLEDPAWLRGGESTEFQNGRKGRVYRTGDLVRYNDDMSLQFQGRRDGQVKIRGQRVEIGDVENNVLRNLTATDQETQVVAEVFVPRDGAHAVLAVFVQPYLLLKDESLEDAVAQLTVGIEERLAQVLPHHMRPVSYVAIDALPKTGTGKIDRRRIREMGSSWTLQELTDRDRASKSDGEQSKLRRLIETPTEQALRDLWAIVLSIEPEAITHADQSFIQIGGDSIAAMRLVAAARRRGLRLSVADVLSRPHLSEMAETADRPAYQTSKSDGSKLNGEETNIPQPFSVLSSDADIESAVLHAATVCEVSVELIEDIYPCTPLQEAFMALTAQHTEDAVERDVYKLPGNIDLDKLRAAWNSMVKATPILRTRIVDIPRLGLVQVVLSENRQALSKVSTVGLSAFFKRKESPTMGLGLNLVYFDVVTQGEEISVVLTIHHSLYDMFSMNIILESLQRIYQNLEGEPFVPFNIFIEYSKQASNRKKSEVTYWENQFRGADLLQFPKLPSVGYRPIPNNIVTRTINRPSWPKGVTPSTALRCAWALLQAQHTGASEATFGAVVTGRHAHFPGIERVVGPTIATVPVRIVLNRADMCVDNMLAQVHNQAVAMMPFEQTGLPRIRSILRDIGDELENSCDFQTLLVVQPPLGSNLSHEAMFERLDLDPNQESYDRQPILSTTALVLEVQPEQDRLLTRLSFDTNILDEQAAHTFLSEFEHILRRMEEMRQSPIHEFIPSTAPKRNSPHEPYGSIAKENGHLKTKSSHDTSSNEPTSRLEETLREIWASVLNHSLAKISIDTAFTRVGGDSISAMQVVTRARARGITLTVADVLRLQTIRLLSKQCSMLAEPTFSVSATITKHDDGQTFPLSPIQHMFFHYHPSGLNHFNQTSIVRLKSLIPTSRLWTAIRGLVRRHAMLRARFINTPDKGWMQKILIEHQSSGAYLTEHAIDNIQDAQPIIQSRQTDIDVVHGPVFAVDVFKMQNRMIMSFTAHHLVVDLVSWRIIWHDLQQLIETDGALASIPSKPFRLWCEIERERYSPLNRRNFASELHRTALFDYWGVAPGKHEIHDFRTFRRKVDTHTTELLLGSSNDAYRTKPVDIMIAVLVWAFDGVFSDRRDPPVIYVEGHGRDRYQTQASAVDVSDTVGWFTALRPLNLSDIPANMLDSVMIVKDALRGFSSCEAAQYSEIETIGSAKHHTLSFPDIESMEIVFNYSGQFQQLESETSLFEALPPGILPVTEISPHAKAFSLVQVNIDISHGQLSVDFSINRYMKYQPRLEQWLDRYVAGMHQCAQSLRVQSAQPTLSDFALLKISYDDLDGIMRTLSNIGIFLEHICDIFPCSSIQEGILLSKARGTASHASHWIWTCHIDDGAVLPKDLEYAWRTVVSRHSVFSTVFVENSNTGGFLQVVLESPKMNIQHLKSIDRMPIDYLRLLPMPVYKPNEPQYTVTLCTSETGAVACRLDMTHALIDARSIENVISEVVRSYRSDHDLAPTSQFRDAVELTQKRPTSDTLKYWKNYLSGAQPSIFPSSDTKSIALGPLSKQQSLLDINFHRADDVIAFCRGSDISRFAFFQVAWALTLSRFLEKQDICFGYVVSGRDLPIKDVDRIVGPLISVMVARVSLLSHRLDEVLSATYADSVNKLSFQHTTLANIQHELGLKGQRFINTAISVQSQDIEQRDEKLNLSQVDGDDPNEFDLTFGVELSNEGMDLSLIYRTDQINCETALEVRTVLIAAVDYILDNRPSQPTKLLLHATDLDFNGVNLSNAVEKNLAANHLTLSDDFFLHHVGAHEQDAVSFWQREFEEIEGAPFPELPISNHRSKTDSVLVHPVSLMKEATINTRLTFLASWAILQASYTAEPEACFGLTLGDNIVPIRIPLDWKSCTVVELLRRIQDRLDKITVYKKTGLHRIRRISQNTAQACDFRTLLVTGDESEQTAGNGHNHRALDCEVGRSSISPVLLVKYQPRDEQISLVFDPTVVHMIQAKRISHQLEHIFRLLCDPTHERVILSELNLLNLKDIDEIWSWNANVPHQVNEAVHNIIARTIQGQPDAPAVCSWDGELTYKQLDLLSTKVAQRLIGMGVGAGTIIPLCFEKSMFVPIVALAVMKTGAASILLDLGHPEERLRSIVRQIDPIMIAASAGSKTLAARLSTAPVLPVSSLDIDAWPGTETQNLPTVDPASALYCISTSGTTGQPKSIIVTHANFASAIRHQQHALGYDSHSRVFSFASHAFDVVWCDLINSLTSGGCLCIPSSNDRMEDLIGSARQLRVNYAHLTPSIGRAIDLSDLPGIKTWQFGGEPLRGVDFSALSSSTRVIHTYGPAECSPTASAKELQLHERGSDITNIGRGLGSTLWIMGLDGRSPAMIGCIGELWIEGPIVGEGYVNDQVKSSMAFVDNPEWVQQDSRSSKSLHRRRRFFKTGDMVKYGIHGELVFVRRMDHQTKVRGQRVELHEVEFHIQQFALQFDQHQLFQNVAAETVILEGSERVMLVAFVVWSDKINTKFSNESFSEDEMVQRLTEYMSASLPPYMVPAAFIPISAIPVTISGKIDRRQLKEIGRSWIKSRLSAYEPQHQPSTEAEIELQALWAEILQLNPDMISADDSFLGIGGDSIAAMQLVAATKRHQTLSLTVADVLTRPRLSEMAVAATKPLDRIVDEDVLPFSLLFEEIRKTAVERVALSCGVNQDAIEDVFPCTPLQEGMFAMADDYVTRLVYEVASEVDLSKLQTAWERVIETTSILRTRIVDLPGQGLVQVVIRQTQKPQWRNQSTFEAYLQDDKHSSMGLGDILSRLGFVCEESGKRSLIWTIHHGIFDGWTLSLILSTVVKAYKGEKSVDILPFQSFVQGSAVDTKAAMTFWREQCSGTAGIRFPDVSLTRAKKTQASHSFKVHILGLSWGSLRDYTASTAIRAAWALLQARYTGADEAVFGEVLSGREVATNSSIETIGGPTIATVPVRITLDWQITIAALLKQIQTQSAETIEYEQTGIQNIRRASNEAALCCAFATLFVIQPATRNEEHQNLLVLQEDTANDGDNRSDLGILKGYALVVEWHLEKNGVSLNLTCDPDIIEPPQVELMARQLEQLLREICGPNQTARIGDLSTANEQDLSRIWNWNANVPPLIDRCVHELIIESIQRQPEQKLAIHAWNGSISYADLHKRSLKLARYLVKKLATEMTGEKQAQAVIPLFLEKSMWTPVAMLAVMLAGATAVLIDINQPEERLESIVSQVHPKLILASRTSAVLAQRVRPGASVVRIDQDFLLNLDGEALQQVTLPKVEPSSILSIVFTSGSTGRPKGIKTSHANFCSAVVHQKALEFSDATRTFDFASHAFDAAWYNVIHTLAVAGTVCIPSEDERKNDLSGAILRYGANFVNLTPSVAATLDDAAISALHVLELGGEAASQALIDRAAMLTRVRVAYGPAEVTVVSTVTQDRCRNSEIGRGTGVRTWIVSLADRDQLAMVGAVGELCVEGPLVGQGYLDDPERSSIESVFVEDPKWLLKGGPGQPGRRGRVYYTGDLVRYSDSNGSLTFTGRNDGQLKVRGQRVELKEIEVHLQQALLHLSDQGSTASKIVAEALTPHNSEQDIIVAFVAGWEDEKIEGLTTSLKSRLVARLPVYMIPDAFIPIPSIPMTATGKIDRRRLREIGQSYSRSQLSHLAPLNGSERREPRTLAETQLQALWASVLGVQLHEISIDDSFLHLGGDSIGAMKLVAAARRAGLSLNVAQVLSQPQLADMALLIEKSASQRQPADDEKFTNSNAPPIEFSMEQHEIISSLPGEYQSRVHDILPISHSQRQFLDGSSSQTHVYGINYLFVDFPYTIDFLHLQACCNRLVQHFDILRTVFVSAQESFYQIVLDKLEIAIEQISARSSLDETCHETCEQDCLQQPLLGRPFLRFIYVKDASGLARLIMRISHAQYDGLTLPRLINALGDLIKGEELVPEPSLAALMQHLHSDREVHIGYWKSLLHDPSMTAINAPLAKLSTEPRLLVAKTTRRRLASTDKSSTEASIFAAACALALSRYFNSADVLFGRLVSGRAGLRHEVQDVVGCCIAYNPVRVRFHSDTSIDDVREQVHQQYMDGLPHEHYNVAEMVEDFGFVLVFQNIDQRFKMEAGQSDCEVSFFQSATPMERSDAVKFVVVPEDDSLRLSVVAKSTVCDAGVVQTLLEYFSQALDEF